MSNAIPLRQAADARTVRRERLAVVANPAAHLDYVIKLTGRLSIDIGDEVEIALAYVPDRVVIEPGSFAAYLVLLGAAGFETAEKIGAEVLADIESEVVPRYLRVTVTAGGAGTPGHEARFETRQPTWKNDDAVSRLG